MSGNSPGLIQHRRVFGGEGEREDRRSWREDGENSIKIERRRHGGNYLLSPKLSSLDHAELRGGKERKDPRETKQPTLQRTKRRLPK